MNVLPELSADLIALLVFLLPGFVAAWVLYGLTSHPKPDRFERAVQALILTFVVHALVPVLKWLLFLAGRAFPIMEWTPDSQLVASLVVSVLVGTAMMVCTNKDIPHKWLRKWGKLTLRTAHPSEWFCAFSALPRVVILNLKDGRRLQGWPKEWPVDPSRGQFLLEDPLWIVGDEYLDLPQIDSFLIPVEHVESVEFMKETSYVEPQPQQAE